MNGESVGCASTRVKQIKSYIGRANVRYGWKADIKVPERHETGMQGRQLCFAHLVIKLLVLRSASPQGTLAPGRRRGQFSQGNEHVAVGRFERVDPAAYVT